ncbi:MAG: 50S ribosomal protein L11 methyltransferase, partial [Rubritepida sp.]|nr:50S ribosomal protein L11 methyltransferase [Rubritepida sp.]
MKRHPQPLESLVLEALPEAAVPAYEAALQAVSATVALFRDEATDTWRIEAVREATADDGALLAALALAAGLKGDDAPLAGARVVAVGWLERTMEAFAVQRIGLRLL